MVLELHIWGPAFGLPSIDAPCLATVFYLSQALPSRAWAIVPSSDPNVSPLGELPALRDGDAWVAGFSNIIAYLRHTSHGEWDLDAQLNDTQQADSAAFSSFVESRGQPLLDLSLYVSSDNYFASTRPALGDILTWPNSWVVPHSLREKAKKRSDHLGLSSLDVDTAQGDKGEDAGLSAHIPQSLRKPRQTVSGLLGRNLQKSRFRIDAVTADFFEPLLDRLGDKKWLIGSSVSSVDCLTIGYLCLLQVPELPQSFAKDALRTKYTKLGDWAQAESIPALGPPADVATVLGIKRSVASTESRLPWQVPTERTFQQILQSVLHGCISSIPGVGQAYTVPEIGYLPDHHDHYQGKQLALTRIHRRRDIYVQTLASTFAITGLVGWLVYNGKLRLPRRTITPKGRTFGEAGALLGLG